MKKEEKLQSKIEERSPVVVIMGHIDHGKSTLLSYIRKSKKPLNEAGDITQHISAYEVPHTTKEGKKSKITFLDTPGHEAFGGIRKRGANVSDIAVLVVSAEDGVKPQTIDALNRIKESQTPYVVAINKIDKPDANIDRTKQTLVENEIYVEGYGGNIPVVEVSAKTGQGVSDLLDMIILMAELEELKGDRNKLANGIIIESNLDVKKGITATCVIKDGSLKKGMYVVSGKSISPIRIFENFENKPINEASFSSPVKIIGWDSQPIVGKEFIACNTREEAKELLMNTNDDSKNISQNENSESPNIKLLPIIVKADTGSSLEAVLNEIKKLNKDKIKTKVISSGIGTVGEGDVRLAMSKDKTFIIGFNTNTDSTAKSLAERSDVSISNFNIIYKLTEWLDEILKQNTPKEEVLESTGRAKILKIFSKTKNKQVLGGRHESGSIKLESVVKIIRRDSVIGEGRVKELQQQRVQSKEITSGEFGAMVEAPIEIAPGDYIESFILVQK